MAVAAPIISAITAPGLAGIITRFALSIAVSFITQKLFSPDVPDAGGVGGEQAPDQGVKQRIPTDPNNKLPVVYGESRVYGTITYADITDDNQTMAFIISLCEGPVSSIGTIFWDDYELTLDGDGNVTDAVDANGNSDDFLNGNLIVRKFAAGGRCSDMEAFSSAWGANGANRSMPNVAYIYVELTYNRDEGVTGLTSKLGAQIMGKTVRIMNGVLNTPINSDTFFALSTGFSDNPADCLLDYLTDTTYGCGFKDSEIDLFGLNNQKFFTNQIVPFIDERGASTTGKLYTCNGVINTNDTKDLVLSDLTVNQGCIFGWQFGQFKIQRDAAFDTSFDIVKIGDDDLYGDITVVNDGFNSQINEFNISFNSKAQRYQDDQVFLTIPESRKAYNEPKLVQETRFKFCNNSVEAQRAGAVILNTARNNLVVSFTCDISKIQIELLDVIALTNTTYGFQDKLFRINSVTETEIGANGVAGFLYTAKEYAGVDYTVDGTIQAEDTAPNTSLPNPRAFGFISDLTSISSNVTSSNPFVELSWTVPTGLCESFEIWTGSDINQAEQLRDYNSLFSNSTGPFISGTRVNHRVYNLDFSNNLVFWVKPINQFAKGAFSIAYNFGAFQPAGIPIITGNGGVIIDDGEVDSVRDRFVQIQYGDDMDGLNIRGTYDESQAVQEVNYTGEEINTLTRTGNSNGTGTITFPTGFDSGTFTREIQELSFEGTRANVGTKELLHFNLIDVSSNTAILDSYELIRDFGPAGFINTIQASNEAYVNGIDPLHTAVTGEIPAGNSSVYTYKTRTYITRIPQNYISVYNNSDLTTELFQIPLERTGFERVEPNDNDVNSIIGNVVEDETMICYKRTTSVVGAFVIEIYNLDFVNNTTTYNSTITPGFNFLRTNFANQNGGQTATIVPNWAPTPIAMTKVTDSGGNPRVFAAASGIRFGLPTTNHATWSDTTINGGGGQQYVADTTDINSLTWSATTNQTEWMSSQRATSLSFGTGGLPTGARGIRVMGDIVLWAQAAIAIPQTTGTAQDVIYKRWNNSSNEWENQTLFTYSDNRGGGRSTTLGFNSGDNGFLFAHLGGDSFSNRPEEAYVFYRTSAALPTLGVTTILRGNNQGNNSFRGVGNSSITDNNFIIVDTNGSTSTITNARMWSYDNSGTITNIFDVLPGTDLDWNRPTRLFNNDIQFVQQSPSNPQDYNIFDLDTTADTAVLDYSSFGPLGAGGLGSTTSNFGLYAQIGTTTAYVNSDDSLYSFSLIGSTWTFINRIVNTFPLVNAGENIISYDQSTNTIYYYDNDLNEIILPVNNDFDITNNIVEANETYMAWYNGSTVRAYFFEEERFQDLETISGVLSIKIKSNEVVTVSTATTVREISLNRPAVANTYALDITGAGLSTVLNLDLFAYSQDAYFQIIPGVNTATIEKRTFDGTIITSFETDTAQNAGATGAETRLFNGQSGALLKVSGTGNWIFALIRNNGPNAVSTTVDNEASSYTRNAFYLTNAGGTRQWLENQVYFNGDTVLREEADGTWSTYTAGIAGGSTNTVALAIGDTVVTVVDIADFAPTTGRISIGGNDYNYNSIVGNNIFLNTPIVAAAAVGTVVAAYVSFDPRGGTSPGWGAPDTTNETVSYTERLYTSDYQADQRRNSPGGFTFPNSFFIDEVGDDGSLGGVLTTSNASFADIKARTFGLDISATTSLPIFANADAPVRPGTPTTEVRGGTYLDSDGSVNRGVIDNLEIRTVFGDSGTSFGSGEAMTFFNRQGAGKYINFVYEANAAREVVGYLTGNFNYVQDGTGTGDNFNTAPVGAYSLPSLPQQQDSNPDGMFYSNVLGGKDYMMYSVSNLGVVSWTINMANTSGDFSALTSITTISDSILNGIGLPFNAWGDLNPTFGRNLQMWISDEVRSATNPEFTINFIQSNNRSIRRWRITASGATQLPTIDNGATGTYEFNFNRIGYANLAGVTPTTTDELALTLATQIDALADWSASSNGSIVTLSYLIDDILQTQTFTSPGTTIESVYDGIGNPTGEDIITDFDMFNSQYNMHILDDNNIIVRPIDGNFNLNQYRYAQGVSENETRTYIYRNASGTEDPNVPYIDVYDYQNNIIQTLAFDDSGNDATYLFSGANTNSWDVSASGNWIAATRSSRSGTEGYSYDSFYFTDANFTPQYLEGATYADSSVVLAADRANNNIFSVWTNSSGADTTERPESGSTVWTASATNGNVEYRIKPSTAFATNANDLDNIFNIKLGENPTDGSAECVYTNTGKNVNATGRYRSWNIQVNATETYLGDQFSDTAQSHRGSRSGLFATRTGSFIYADSTVPDTGNTYAAGQITNVVTSLTLPNANSSDPDGVAFNPSRGTGGYITFGQVVANNSNIWGNTWYSYDDFDGTNGAASLTTLAPSADSTVSHYTHFIGGKDFMMYGVWNDTTQQVDWTINRASVSGNFSSLIDVSSVITSDILNSIDLPANAFNPFPDNDISPLTGYNTTTPDGNRVNLWITDEDSVNNEFTINLMTSFEGIYRRYRVTSSGATLTGSFILPGITSTGVTRYTLNPVTYIYEPIAEYGERGDIIGFETSFAIGNDIFGFDPNAPNVGAQVRWISGTDTRISFDLGSLGSLNNLHIPAGLTALTALTYIKTQLENEFPSLIISNPNFLDDYHPFDDTENRSGYGITINLGLGTNEVTEVLVNDVNSDGSNINLFAEYETDGSGEVVSTIITLTNPNGNETYNFSFVADNRSDNNVKEITDTITNFINTNTENPYDWTCAVDPDDERNLIFTSVSGVPSDPTKLWKGFVNNGTISGLDAGDIRFNQQALTVSGFEGVGGFVYYDFTELNGEYTQITTIPTFSDQFALNGNTVVDTASAVYQKGDYYIWKRLDTDNRLGGWTISKTQIRGALSNLLLPDTIQRPTGTTNQITAVNSNVNYVRSMIINPNALGNAPAQIESVSIDNIGTDVVKTITFTTDLDNAFWVVGRPMYTYSHTQSNLWATLNVTPDPQNADLLNSDGNWNARGGNEDPIGFLDSFTPGTSSAGIVTISASSEKSATIVTPGQETTSLTTCINLSPIDYALVQFDGITVTGNEQCIKHVFSENLDEFEAATEFAAAFNNYFNTFGQLNVIASNFADEHAVFNGTYELIDIADAIPTFTGDFDPASNDPAERVPGTNIYRYFSNDDQRYYYLWNRLDAGNSARGGWHISAEGVTDMGGPNANTDTGFVVDSYSSGTPDSIVTTTVSHNLQVGDLVTGSLAGTPTEILDVPSSDSFTVINTNIFATGNIIYRSEPTQRDLPWSFLANTSTPQLELEFATTGWFDVEAGAPAPASGQITISSGQTIRDDNRSNYMEATVSASGNVVTITSFIQDDTNLVNTCTDPTVIIPAFNEGNIGTLSGDRTTFTDVELTYPDGTQAFTGSFIGFSPPIIGRINNADEVIQFMNQTVTDWEILKDIPTQNKIRLTSVENMFVNSSFMLTFNNNGGNGNIQTSPITASIVAFGGQTPTYFGLRSRRLGEQNIISTDPLDYSWFPITQNSLGTILPTYKVEVANEPRFRFDFIENGIPAVDRLGGFFQVPFSNIIDTLVLTAEEIYDIPIIRPQDTGNLFDGTIQIYINANIYLALPVNTTADITGLGTLDATNTGATVFANADGITIGSFTSVKNDLFRWTGTDWVQVAT